MTMVLISSQYFRILSFTIHGLFLSAILLRSHRLLSYFVNFHNFRYADCYSIMDLWVIIGFYKNVKVLPLRCDNRMHFAIGHNVLLH